MSIQHTADPKHDPKFVPPAAALKVVGLTVAQVKTDDALLELINHNNGQIRLLDDQIAVAVYIFQQRGWTYEMLIPKIGGSERTLKRKAVEGMAILRTKEVTRTTSAIRAGELSKKVVDEITSSTADPETKIRQLEEAALAVALGGYVDDAGKPATADAKVDVLHSRLTQVVEDQARPVTAANIISALPQIAEETGFKVKEVKRSSNSEGGKDNPMGLEHNLRKALADLLAVEKAAEAPYVPSPQEVAALLALVDAISIRCNHGVELMMDEDTEAAVKALAKAGM